MNARLAQLLDNPRLGLRTAESMPVRADGRAGRFPVAAGEVHEWFLAGDFPQQGQWYPPVTVMAGVAHGILEEKKEQAESEARRRIVWIGRCCWPAFQLLRGLREGGGWREGSLFLDPASAAERFWAIAEALACPGVGAVIADGSGMTPTVSRRLQLAAETGRVLGLIARPPWEMGTASHAAGRWEVRARETGPGKTGWHIRLAGSGAPGRRGQDAPRHWVADWAYRVFRGTGALDLSAVVGHGIAASPERREAAG